MTIGRALLGLVFPLDFSSAHTRFLFRLPSLYFLAKSAAMWITLLVQSQDDSAFTHIAILQPIGNWVAQKSMEDVCWYTFMATCFTLCIGTLTTGLEGLNINESAPFNLVSHFLRMDVRV